MKTLTNATNSVFQGPNLGKLRHLESEYSRAREKNPFLQKLGKIGHLPHLHLDLYLFCVLYALIYSEGFVLVIVNVVAKHLELK